LIQRTSVYVYARQLKESKYVKTERPPELLNKPGNPKFLVAEPRIVKQHIKNIWEPISKVLHGNPSAENIKKEIREVEDYLKLTASLTQYLPQYMPLFFEGWRDARDLIWTDTLSVYFYFNQRILDAAWAVAKDHDSKPNASELQALLDKFEAERKEHHWTAPPVRPYLIEAIKEGAISYPDVKSIGSKCVHGQNDLFNPSTLSCRLILIHLGALHFHVGTNMASMMKQLSNIRP